MFDHFKGNSDFQQLSISSWSDWIQSLINSYNTLFAHSSVVDRFRIDKITVVPDKSLPLEPVTASAGDPYPFEDGPARPKASDKTVDIQWGFPVQPDLPSYDKYIGSLDGFYLHENLHARNLPDNYSFNVHHGTNNSLVAITEKGAPVAGSKYLPGVRTIVNGVAGLQLYRTKEDDLMADAGKVSLGAFSVLLMNSMKGERAVFGNYNAPEDFNIHFFSLLPANNILRIKDSNGIVLSNCSVKIFRASEPASFSEIAVYPMYFDDTADMDLVADANGEVNAGQNPFGSGSVVPLTSKYFGGTIILRVEKNSAVGYTFLQASDFITQYLMGKKDQATYDVKVNLLN